MSCDGCGVEPVPAADALLPEAMPEEPNKEDMGFEALSCSIRFYVEASAASH